jgi:hypothetical protein
MLIKAMEEAHSEATVYAAHLQKREVARIMTSGLTSNRSASVAEAGVNTEEEKV